MNENCESCAYLQAEVQEANERAMMFEEELADLKTAFGEFVDRIEGLL